MVECLGGTPGSAYKYYTSEEGKLRRHEVTSLLKEVQMLEVAPGAGRSTTGPGGCRPLAGTDVVPILGARDDDMDLDDLCLAIARCAVPCHGHGPLGMGWDGMGWDGMGS